MRLGVAPRGSGGASSIDDRLLLEVVRSVGGRTQPAPSVKESSLRRRHKASGSSLRSSKLRCLLGQSVSKPVGSPVNRGDSAPAGTLGLANGRGANGPGAAGPGAAGPGAAGLLPPEAERVAPLPAGFMRKGLEAAAKVVRGRLPSWPLHVNTFLELVMIANGAAKALSIRDGFQCYVRALAAVHARTSRLVGELERLRAATERDLATLRAAMRADSESPSAAGPAPPPPRLPPSCGEPAPPPPPPDAGRQERQEKLLLLCQREVHVTKHLNLLSGVHEANALLLRMLGRLLSSSQPAPATTTAPAESPGPLAHGLPTGPEQTSLERPPSPTPPPPEASVLSSGGEQLSRCFVACDGARGARSLFVPPEFAALCGLLTAADDDARRLELLMRAAIDAEGWPPPASAGRIRVQAEGGTLECHRCRRRFTKHCECCHKAPCQFPRHPTRAPLASLWNVSLYSSLLSLSPSLPPSLPPLSPSLPPTSLTIHGRRSTPGGFHGGAAGCFSGVCTQCEAALRAAGVCPFASSARTNADGRAAASHAFCPHQSKCAVCDGGFLPCPLCKLARGDGERCAEICSELSPSPPRCVFVDFDRTLCSTKGGRSPLLGLHTVDAELAKLAAALPVHVVTRNPHGAEIESFLAARGVPVEGVHVVPKRTSKADVMVQLLPDLLTTMAPPPPLPPPVIAVFIDDDVRELSRASVAELPLLRVLFRRTGL